MSNTISHRIYVSGLLTTQGPVLVGSGSDENADCDFVRDGCDLPMLPSSSLAGAFRSTLRDAGVADGEIDRLLGERGQVLRQSPTTLYDATLVHTGTPDEALRTLRTQNRLRIRDSVRLEDTGRTARDGGKFDFEVLESGVGFNFRCELTGWSSDEDTWERRRDVLAQLMEMLAGSGVSIGAKTTRGLGSVKLTQSRWLDLDMRPGHDGQTWVEFDWDTTMEHQGIAPPQPSRSLSVNSWQFKVDFKPMGPLLIRSYTSRPDEPDYVQFKAGNNTTIPGTSWAGVLRHAVFNIVDRISALLPASEWRKSAAEALTADLFGPHLDNLKTKAVRSALSVQESTVTGGLDLDYTRNRIDRFTGGVVESALFTERPSFPALADDGSRHMSASLSMSLAERSSTVVFEAQIGALYLVLCDMAHGLQPIGGESSVGRGILEAAAVAVTRPDGKSEQWSLDGAAEQAKPYLTSLYQWLYKEGR